MRQDGGTGIVRSAAAYRIDDARVLAADLGLEGRDRASLVCVMWMAPLRYCPRNDHVEIRSRFPEASAIA